ncbi:MAG: hypothetical protein ABR499_19145 [Gemmatimonadaceae bacterium]
MRIRPYADADWPEWLRMSLALFPDEPPEEIERGMRDTLANPRAAVFIAVREDATACGFVEVGERSYAEGCETSPVGYVEAWYVDADVRNTLSPPAPPDDPSMVRTYGLTRMMAH